MPFLYPTPEGGLLAEWRLGANEISLEIEPDSHNGRVHVLNLKTDEDDEFLLDLDADGWDRLAEFISSKVGNNA